MTKQSNPSISKKKVPVGWMVVYKRWIYNPFREVFRRSKDGLEIDKRFAYWNIDLNSDSLEEELDKLAVKNGYD